MSLIKFKHNNVLYGIVRNQKCATTTMMSYVAQALWNADPLEIQSYNTFQNNAPGVYIKKSNFEDYAQDLLECDVKIALWREPVDKFVSGFYHTMFNPTGAQDSLWIGHERCLDNFLDNFEYYKQNSNVQDHCSTNTARLGDDNCVYTHIWHYSDVYRIAQLLDVPSEGIFHRKSAERPALTFDQIDLIEDIMFEDIVNGWNY